MKKQNFNLANLFLLIFASASLLFSACKKDGETEQENITKFVLHFSGVGFDKEFVWEDADGPGGNNPTMEEIQLPSNASLHCHIHVFDGNEDLTEEIEAEKNAHLFTFTETGGLFTVDYGDVDGNGKNFGLETEWTTAAAAEGKVRVRLFHEPTDKSNVETPGGEVDFDQTFVVKIK